MNIFAMKLIYYFVVEVSWIYIYFFLFWQQSSQLMTRNLDERVNGKGAISRYFSDTSANASGSIFYLYERMNVLRCKIIFYYYFFFV